MTSPVVRVTSDQVAAARALRTLLGPDDTPPAVAKIADADLSVVPPTPTPTPQVVYIPVTAPARSDRPGSPDLRGSSQQPDGGSDDWFFEAKAFEREPSVRPDPRDMMRFVWHETAGTPVSVPASDAVRIFWVVDDLGRGDTRWVGNSGAHDYLPLWAATPVSPVLAAFYASGSDPAAVLAALGAHGHVVVAGQMDEASREALASQIKAAWAEHDPDL